MEIEESKNIQAFFGDGLFLLRRLALRRWPVRNFFISIFASQFLVQLRQFRGIYFPFRIIFRKKDHRIQIYIQLNQPKFFVNY